MEYLNRLSNLVASPAKTASSLGAARRRKASAHLYDGSPEAFKRDWEAVKSALERPDERALFFGIERTDVPDRLRCMVDALVFESNRSTDGQTGPCMEHLLKHELLEELVQLGAGDQPAGILAEIIRTLTNLVILLDEKFLSQQAAHRPISLLLQICMHGGPGGDEEEHDGSVLPARRTARLKTVSDVDADYQSDLVDLMCHVASRIRNTPELLLIFISDERIKAQSMDDIADDDAVIMLAPDDAGSPAEHSEDRPASPAGSVDSVATLQPTKTGAVPAATNGGGQTYRRLRFPLFSHLLRFAHREGRTGELARAGLLFLITLEVHASGSRSRGKGRASLTPVNTDLANADRAQAEELKSALATFVANSDFADVFGAGLGAAYGLLPTRVYTAPSHDPTRAPRGDAAIGRSSSQLNLGSAAAASGPDDHSSTSLSTATRSDSPELQAQLRLLVDLLDFAQDVVDAIGLGSKPSSRTTSVTTPSSSAVPTGPSVDTTMEKLAMSVAVAVRDTFIKNVVYPSLMESSDVDGSATAVMGYLDVVMLVLREKHMLTEVVLQYLLCYERLPSDDVQLNEAEATASRLAYRLADDGADRYSLKDLILDNMEVGRATSATTTAMKLARTLIVSHGRHANNALLDPRRPTARPAVAQQPGDEGELDHPWGGTAPSAKVPGGEEGEPLQVSQHIKEIDAYAALLSRLESVGGPEALLNNLSPYLLDAEQAIRHDSCFEAAIKPLSRRRQEQHQRGERSDSAHWRQVQLASGDGFLQQVLELMARLFRQPPELNLALSGVLTALAISPERSLKGVFSFNSEADDDAVPAVLDLLTSLSQHVEGYRRSVPDFERYLAERRKGLLLVDDLTDAIELGDLTEDDSFDEKPSSGDGKSSGTGEAGKKMTPSLSLPRVRSSKAQTQEDLAPGLEGLKVVEDSRAELSPEVANISATNAADTPSHDDAESTSGAKAGPGAETRSSALARLFGGRSVKNGSAGAASMAPSASRDRSKASEPGKIVASAISPYTRHYQETRAVTVRACTATGAEGWRRHVEVRAMDAGKEDADIVTLSSVLDNTILLEELIKEVIAIIEVRRAWGIDPVCFSV